MRMPSTENVRSPMPFRRIWVPFTIRISGIDTPSRSAAWETDTATKAAAAKINPRTMATSRVPHHFCQTIQSVNGGRQPLRDQPDQRPHQVTPAQAESHVYGLTPPPWTGKPLLIDDDVPRLPPD